MGAVKYLLDTHTFLWATHDGAMLSRAVVSIIENPTTQIFVSAVSAYEIMYKYKLGKLPGYAYVAENYFDILRELGADELPINTRHAHLAGKIEWAHRDPFDRFLAAQAAIDNLCLITNDSAFQELERVDSLW